MSEYKPNSHRYKEEQNKSVEKKKLDKVVSGTAQIKKKNEISKIASAFITDDVKNVKSYILDDVLIPAIANTILDIIVGSANMIFGGRGKTGRSSGTNAGYVTYGNAYNTPKNRVNRVTEPTRTNSAFSYDDIVLKGCSRGEAEQVLDRMRESIDTYGMVSIADLYDLVGISHNYTDNKYGWTNLQNARVIRVRDGYAFEMPAAKPLDK